MNIEHMKQWLEALEGLVDLAHEAGFPCDRAEAAITSLRQAIEQAKKQDVEQSSTESKETFDQPMAYTTGHCKEKAKLNGCQLHNLHCGYPACDRKPSTTPQLTIKESLTVQQEKQEPVAYPEGYVVGPCICGSWPGGKCLKCPRITPQPQEKS